MDDQVQNPKWRIVTGSVQGATHKNLGIPNQDAVNYSQNTPENLPVILSVADGIGSPDFFRSDRGSRFAVETAVESANQLIDHVRAMDELSENVIRDQFCRTFTRHWMERVIKDYHEDPPENTVIESNERKANFYYQSTGFENDTQKSEAIAAYPYSTTSITLIATPQFLIVVQIGNGDVLMIEPAGVISRPFPVVLQDIGVLSVSVPESWKLFEIWHKDNSDGSLPVAVFLTTDGYRDSYDFEQDFEKYCISVFHDFFTQYDVETIQEGVSSVLYRVSLEGSGDDVTIGILCDPEVFRNTSLSFPEVPQPCKELPVTPVSEIIDAGFVGKPLDGKAGGNLQESPVGSTIEGQASSISEGLEPAGRLTEPSGSPGILDTDIDSLEPLFEDQCPEDEEKKKNEKVQ
jgi:hypothetical protein